jgi:hypothetical protein
LVNVIDPPTADKIGIERYPQTKPLDLDILGPHLDRSTRIPGYLVPISLPGVVSFVAPAYVYDESPMNAMNIISAPQFLDNGIEFTLNEHSASFLNLGDIERKYSSWVIRSNT